MKDSRTAVMGLVSVIVAVAPAASLVPRSPQWMEVTRFWGPVLAVALAILTLIRIKVSAGALTGRGWAWTGLVIGAGQIIFWLGILSIFFRGGHLAH